MTLRPLIIALTLSATVLSGCKEETPVADALEASAPVTTAPAEATPVSAAPVTAAPKPVRKPRPVVATAPQPVVAAEQPRAICNDCGTITRMTAIEKEGDASGAGAVLGAIAGGLIGSQIGNGRGSQAAAAAGAVAGGVGGHMAEKKIRESTAYKVTVKMDSGYTRNVTITSEQAANYTVGSQVRLDDNDNLSPR